MIKGRWGRGTLLAPVLVVSLILLGSSAWADPASDLSEAESRAASAETDIAAAQQRLDAARADYAAASRRAGPAAEAARAARAEARYLRAQLFDRQRQARAEIAELEAAQRQEEDDHDDEVATGVGIGLAALVASGIALAWGWFRASAAVAALVRLQLGQAVALCLGGGFLLLVAGAGLATGDGLPAALGMSIFCLGFVLPTALLLARHSAEIQRGRAKPALGQQRLPSWIPRSAAVLLFLLGIGGFGAAVLAEEPTAPSLSPALREDADALTTSPGAARLAEAKAEATATRKQAAGPLAWQRAARIELRSAIRGLRSADARLVDAEADERRFARRLAVVIKREERQVEAQAEREAEELEEEAEPVSECDPNYSGCVPSYPPDVDCAEVGGSVSVYGSDPHGLDADGDGVGCE